MKIASNVRTRGAAAAIAVACLSAFQAAPARAESVIDSGAAGASGPVWSDALVRKGKAAPGAKRAECKDGSYSLAAHRKARACAHHGGVVRWL